jgi:hypothetical protein
MILPWASAVVNRHCTPTSRSLRPSCHAPTSRSISRADSIRRPRHCRDSTLSSISAMFSHDPCLGV